MASNEKWEYMFLILGSYGILPGGGVFVISPEGDRKKICGHDGNKTQTIKILNEYGEWGWEVAGVDSTTSSYGRIYITTWTLKRPIPSTNRD